MFYCRPYLSWRSEVLGGLATEQQSKAQSEAVPPKSKKRIINYFLVLMIPAAVQGSRYVSIVSVSYSLLE